MTESYAAGNTLKGKGEHGILFWAKDFEVRCIPVGESLEESSKNDPKVQKIGPVEE